MGGGKTTNLSNILVYEEQEIPHIETSGDAILVTVRPFRLDHQPAFSPSTSLVLGPNNAHLKVPGLLMVSALTTLCETYPARTKQLFNPLGV